MFPPRLCSVEAARRRLEAAHGDDAGGGGRLGPDVPPQMRTNGKSEASGSTQLDPESFKVLARGLATAYVIDLGYLCLVPSPFRYRPGASWIGNSKPHWRAVLQKKPEVDPSTMAPTMKTSPKTPGGGEPRDGGRKPCNTNQQF
ncbi:hypothetical protein OPT61_g2111 [Boeremia exigua]|uniref:Uncharacterized protein n=1 Tax=Boeremia exigua TaxID=749465 RepID=A0ACC2IMN6_9PLEO|nr:hypothetical protein OPT61_g2111 [Boeremia exigua]